MNHANTVLDDVCALIGFSATVRLVEWLGGRHVYVPCDPTPDHPLAKLIGAGALRALAGEFGGQPLWVPAHVLHRHHKATALKKQVAKLLFAGGTPQTVSRDLGISERQAQRIRKQLMEAGLVPASILATGPGRDSGGAGAPA